VWAVYLLFVPPTSLYHMFLDPGLTPSVRALGSLLSLFISVPTVAVFLIIVASLEAAGRARGAAGLFGWVRLLPWREPAMHAVAMAIVNLALGGAFAFVLIQERLAPLLSDTFFVPAYFHFLTVGAVSLSLLAALGRVIAGLTGHALPAAPIGAPRTSLGPVSGPAWAAPLLVGGLVAAMFAATAAAFILMRGLPLLGAGGGH
jgi:cytochrome c oxidase subunit 1